MTITEVLRESRQNLHRVRELLASTFVAPPPELDYIESTLQGLEKLAASKLKRREREWVQKRASQLAAECRDHLRPAIAARLRALGADDVPDVQDPSPVERQLDALWAAAGEGA